MKSAWKVRFDVPDGDHTDMASATLPGLAPMLPRDVVATLAQASGMSPAEVRENPGDKDGPPILPFEVGLYAAMLVTGQWGADTTETVLDGNFRRRSLAVIQGGAERPPASAMPRKQLATQLAASRGRVRLSASFADRMEALDEELERLIRRVRGKGAEAWPPQLRKMLRAVRYAKTATSVFDDQGRPLGLPPSAEDGGWNPIVMGNSKLNFASYSELPMATCPGAGACARALVVKSPVAKTAPGTQWCYSFKSYRSPSAWGRWWLSTLANTLDRELAIQAGRALDSRRGGTGEGDSSTDRARYGMLGRARREWPRYAISLALLATAKGREKGPQFLRLFVDGDIGHPDDVAAWMDAIRPAKKQNLEVYGYSKAWLSFASLDAWYKLHGETWPENYTLNMSSGSDYEGPRWNALRTIVGGLPITRGTFQAVPFKKGLIEKYLPQLVEQARSLKAYERAHAGGAAVVPMTPYGSGSERFDPHRIRTFTLLADAKSRDDVDHAFATLGYVPNIDWSRAGKLTEPKVRWLGYRELFRFLANEPDFGARVRMELRRDDEPATAENELRAYEELQRASLSEALNRLVDPSDLGKAVSDKTLALAAHEALWSLDVGGSCPLVCGNCSDHPTDPTQGVHRCASKVAFKGKTISIGRH